MSRIGKQPVIIPEKVKVDLKAGNTVLVEGPKGKVQKSFADVVTIEVANKQVTVAPKDDARFTRAMYGTARSVIAGMVKGVTEGYVKELEIQGVGFKAALKGKQIDMALGYSHPILHDITDGVLDTLGDIMVTITDGVRVKIEGCDKQVVGQLTAELRAYYPPEPYKGKGVRIVGERVRRKEGKTVA